MIKITAPDNFRQERAYIVKIFIKDFLGLDYSLNFLNVSNYELVFDKKKIIIEDHFFIKFTDDIGYLDIENIPKSIQYMSSNLSTEGDIVVIFGDIFTKDSSRLGIDIFAGAFFMLTRWEEFVIDKKDSWGNFPASEALACKHDFLKRPIVNEYVEVLWNFLIENGFNKKRKRNYYKPILTHDIDRIDSKLNVVIILKVFLANVVNMDILKGFKVLFTSVFIKAKFFKDPYFCFEWIMEQSEKIGLKSQFYFMSGGESKKYDNKYSIEDKRLEVVFKSIQNRGHIIGLHPSFYSFNNESLFKKEKRMLERVSHSTIVNGRQHYLKFSVPGTWRIWNNSDMAFDSTMGYLESAGFRCGTGCGYKVFDIEERVEMNLMEYPLVFMDATYRNQLSEGGIFNLAKYFIDISKKYDMDMVMLFHNSILYNGFNINTKRLYLKILKEL